MRCLKPIFVKRIDEHVPCSRCYSCRYNRASQWSFRIMEEEKRSSSSFFLTFTYDTKYLPKCPKGRPTLRKKDMINFFKRLRKTMTRRGVRLKYYCVGEYGTKTARPHYHAIIFNATEKEITDAWKLDGNLLGHLHFGSVTSQSVGYTIKYMMKDYKRKYNDTRCPTFAIMSKGLGLSYLTDAIINWYHQDLTRGYVQLFGGVKAPLPRYYKLRIFDEDQRRRQAAIIDATIAFAPPLNIDEVALYQVRLEHRLKAGTYDASKEVL